MNTKESTPRNVLPFAGPLFGLAGSSLSAGLSGRTEPFSDEAVGDILRYFSSPGCLYSVLPRLVRLDGRSSCSTKGGQNKIWAPKSYRVPRGLL